MSEKKTDEGQLKQMREVPENLFFFFFFGLCSIREKMLVLNLNLNSLLVKRQIDNPSPGALTGGN